MDFNQIHSFFPNEEAEEHDEEDYMESLGKNRRLGCRTKEIR